MPPRSRRIKMYYQCCDHCWHLTKRNNTLSNRHKEPCRNDKCNKGHVQVSEDVTYTIHTEG
jgi:hypothetical protein